MEYKSTPNFETKLRNLREPDLEKTLRRLSSNMTRSAAETAGAFFSANTTPGAIGDSLRPKHPGSLQCSQRNIGEKYEMICNLAVEKSDWDRMFSKAESERLKMDTFCEMANCICGTILGDQDFSDEFGFMIPCVPFSASSRGLPGSRSLRGAFRLSGILVYFSFTLQESCAMPAQAHGFSIAA